MILTYRIAKSVANGFASRPSGMNGRFTTSGRGRVAIYRENLFQINIWPGDIYQICPMEYSKSIRDRINSMIPFKISKHQGHAGWLFPNNVSFSDTMKLNKDGTQNVPMDASIPPKLAKIINGDDEERVVKPKKKLSIKDIPQFVQYPVLPSARLAESARQRNVLDGYLRDSGTLQPPSVAIEPTYDPSPLGSVDNPF